MATLSLAALPLTSSFSIVPKGSTPSPFSLSFPAPSSSSKCGGLTIRCVRVGGVEIPNNKRVEFSLQYIHGIGRNRARQILCDLSLENKVTKDLSDDELISLRDEVSKYMIEGDLDSCSTSRYTIVQVRSIICTVFFHLGIAEAVQ
ncbi:30S ribosomal protein S13, chloroplastic-like isoform X2 [Ananas comosus]|uniref:30S ribosomal protein S13, chloroplastic-like isoform X2 n=1 Tax=Ananas comosus TaxID=4615 RepID=A0A6P5G429_ANACO|nr:30S ribosomal protein S13, chloroplastic-like isoform X2 [Ananas comosus]